MLSDLKELAGTIARCSTTQGALTSKRVLEEVVAWISSTPKPLNRLNQSGMSRFHETGQELIEELVGAVGCGQHVAIAGPRGCGKSYCIDQAIRLAEERGLIPQNGFVKLQGNKELPRDYLIEDDITLAVEKGGVVPKRKDAPLFRFARREEEGDRRGRPVRGQDGYVICHGVDDKNVLCTDKPLEKHQRIVLFLDEVNRFSDGVLDSLLLLLEEGEVVMGGEVFKLPVVVMMTMNPPGYDASARTLSPPLSARIGRQYRLLSPPLNVLTDIMGRSIVQNLAQNICNDIETDIKLHPPSIDLVRRAAAVTLCAWGDPRSRHPGFEYLSRETHNFLIGMAKSSKTLAGTMRTLNELCHFGPDGRALGDWIVAASVAAIKEARVMRRSEAIPQSSHFISCAVTVLSHKLQDNFSSATRPDNTQRKEEALYLLASSILRSQSREVRELLWRAVDDIEALQQALAGVASSLDPNVVRQKLIELSVTSHTDVERWIVFLTSLRGRFESNSEKSGVRKTIEREMLEVGLLEIHEEGVALADESHQSLLRWLADLVSPDVLKVVLLEVGREIPAMTGSVEQELEGWTFIREGIWKEHATVRRLIQEEGLVELSRERLTRLFGALDQCWLGAEHENAAIYELLETLQQPRVGEYTQLDELQSNVASFVLRSLSLMAQHPERGRGTRRLFRQFEDKYRKLTKL